MKRYDTVLFIGRFQPLHNGHIEVMKQALIRANKNFVILIGSVNGPRNFKNPFTFQQRKDIIESVLRNQLCNFCTDINIVIEPIRDVMYNNNEWMENVQKVINNINSHQGSVAVIGHKKDNTSQYLEWFPQWETIPVDLNENASVVDATTVRNILFEGLNPGFFEGVLPDESYNFLKEFKESDEYVRIQDEYEIVKAYKKSWEAAPYAPTLVCTDAVVFCAGHVLMIKRGAQPGKGQWALPGGFLNQNETIKECAVRELKEETEIDISERTLRKMIEAEVGVVFDHPNRSMRGRTITHAFRFDVELDSKGKMPKTKAGDDASDTKWIAFGDLSEDEIYEDHMFIIKNLRGSRPA